ncbi:glycoside hydrolase family 76 protein [Piloderma croceum F 1598]|uniref:Glycoside hydrolase family 76 protein n=1 Tax=Piloderma croceum (strain F 1598) TaxID=765440 RepID=A0A0C3F294_PILCF|nr:glycoside hydrolase family 76 protein [Piloderma croceum F 1598]
MFLLHIFTILATLLGCSFGLSEIIVNAKPLDHCTRALSDAQTIANRLQSHYFNATSGQFNDGELWTDANTLEDLHNLMLATENNLFGTVADNSYLGKAALNSSTDWSSFIDGSYDDAQWCILALWKIADYKAARGQDNTPYMVSVCICGGGVWWSSAKSYKNAITNELFLLTSASGYLRTRDQNYLDNANKEWAWLINSGMRNSDGLYNDGLNSTDPAACTNNGQTTWTYNQGVVASGLAALSAANGDTSLLDQAEITLDATISRLTVNSILKESCDNVNAATCDHDQQIFKGIWTKHLQYYLDNANDVKITAKYSSFLGSQHSAVINNAKNSNNDISFLPTPDYKGSVWYAPSARGSIWSPESSASGLAACIADAKYGQC